MWYNPVVGMLERDNMTPQQKSILEERFDSSREWWQKQAREEKILKGEFFTEVFESPQSEIYREYVTDELIMHISKTLNETWIGNPRNTAR